MADYMNKFDTAKNFYWGNMNRFNYRKETEYKPLYNKVIDIIKQRLSKFTRNSRTEFNEDGTITQTDIKGGKMTKKNIESSVNDVKSKNAPSTSSTGKRFGRLTWHEPATAR